MMKYTVNEILSKFDEQNVFTRKNYTFVEYYNQLKAFQKVASDLYTENTTADTVRINEVVKAFQSMQQDYHIEENETINAGIEAMKLINKEIAVAAAGKKGEDRVANTFQYVTREDASFYRNIYLSDGFNETELDAIVVTKNGFIILEVKNAKEDITISKSGRILYGNTTCYHDINIGEKMDKKRTLLTKRLTEEFRSLGINKKVVVDSMIVFSTPSGVKIRVNDEFKKENIGFRGSLYKRIDNYSSSTKYTNEELKSINNVIEKMETEQKRFEMTFNPERLKKSFAECYVYLLSQKDQANESLQHKNEPIAAGLFARITEHVKGAYDGILKMVYEMTMRKGMI